MEISTSIKGRLVPRLPARCECSINGSVAAVLVKTKLTLPFHQLISFPKRKLELQLNSGITRIILPPVGGERFRIEIWTAPFAKQMLNRQPH